MFQSQSIPWYLDDKVVREIIQGVHDAVEEKQKQYKVNTKVCFSYLLSPLTGLAQLTNTYIKLYLIEFTPTVIY